MGLSTIVSELLSKSTSVRVAKAVDAVQSRDESNRYATSRGIINTSGSLFYSDTI